MTTIKSKLEANIWKILISDILQKRYYIPILSLYFLTMPDANAKQIGLWAAIGYLAEFLIEIPSGYISDKIGHKLALVLSKIFMIIGVLFLITANSLLFFILAAIFTSFSWAFRSGTKSAFLHETLLQLKKDHLFIKINSRNAAYAALFSSILITLIPLSIDLSLKFPLYISLFFDLIGLFVVLSFFNPSRHKKIKKQSSLLKVLGDSKALGFFPFIMFTSLIAGFSIAKNRYTFQYVENLGFPMMYLGVIMGAAAILHFLIGKNIGNFGDKLNVNKIYFFETILFTLGFVMIAALNNFYLVALVLIILGGYERARRSIVEGYILKKYIKNSSYKATMLSVKGQATMIINVIVVFLIGYIMDYSYEIGFLIMGISLFLLLLTNFYFFKKCLHK